METSLAGYIVPFAVLARVHNDGFEVYPLRSAQEQQGRKNSHNGVSAAWYREWSSTTDRLIRTDTRATHHGQES
jgi:hypothetical protein